MIKSKIKPALAPLAVVLLSIVGALGGVQGAAALGLIVAPSSCFTPDGADAVASSSEETSEALAALAVKADQEEALARHQRAAAIAELEAQLEAADQAEAIAALQAKWQADADTRQANYQKAVKKVLDSHQETVQDAMLGGLEAGLQGYVNTAAKTSGGGSFLGALGLFAIAEFRRRKTEKRLDPNDPTK